MNDNRDFPLEAAWNQIKELETRLAYVDSRCAVVSNQNVVLRLRIEKLETALQLIAAYPGTKGVMLKRFIAVAQKALEQEN
jgi:hypothetical protein